MQDEGADDFVETLTVDEMQCTVDNIILYLKRIVDNNDSIGEQKWECDSTTQTDTEGEIVLRAQAGPNHATVIHVTYDTDTLLVTSCVGLMQSPLLLPEPSARHVPLQAFGELLDFMIVHLCPAMCVPRALYYVVHCMKMCLPPELVDAQISIDETDGEFLLQNTKARRRCTLKLQLDAHGTPALYMITTTRKKATMITRKVDTAFEPMPPQPEGIDFVQHAFCGAKNTQYVQHPLVAQALRVVLNEIGLARMDAEMRTHAETLLLPVTKHVATPPRSRHVAGG